MSAHKTCDNIKKDGALDEQSLVNLEGGALRTAQANGGVRPMCVYSGRNRGCGWEESTARIEQSKKRKTGPRLGKGIGLFVGEVSAFLGQDDANDDGSEWGGKTTKLYDDTTFANWWDVRTKFATSHPAITAPQGTAQAHRLPPAFGSFVRSESGYSSVIGF